MATAPPVFFLRPDETADMNQSRLMGLTVWMPNLARPSRDDPEDVLAYFRMLQDVYGYVTDAVRLPECLQAMWAAAFFLRRFQTVEYKPELIGNSANAQFVVVHDGARGRHSVPQFIKFQVSPGTDDPRLDAMNAVVMREILLRSALGTTATDHILSFSDCYLGVVDKVQMTDPRANPMFHYDIKGQLVDGWLLPVTSATSAADAAKRRIDAISEAEIRLMEDGLTVPGTMGGVAWANMFAPSYATTLLAERPNIRLAPATVFDAIDGTNLNELLYGLDARQDFAPFSDRLRPLFLMMSVLGRYSWVHNDLHTGNVMFDKRKDRMIIIDYGRTLFDPDLLPPDVQDVADRMALKIDLLLKRDILRRMGTTAISAAVYAAAADRTRRFMADASANIQFNIIRPGTGQPVVFNSYLFMYDVATVTLGIIKRATSSRATCVRIKQEMMNHLWNTAIVQFHNGSIIIPNIYAMMRTLRSVYATIPNHMKVLLPGLIWTSAAMTAIYDEATARGENLPYLKAEMFGGDPKDQLIIADIASLSREGYIYAGGFQFMAPMVNRRMFELFTKLRSTIDRFFQTGEIFNTAVVPAPAPGGGLGTSATASAAASATALRFSRARRTTATVTAPKRRGADRLPDPTPMVDTRRPKPTAWTRKALSEYVSPLSALPSVFRIDAETGAVVPVEGAGAGAGVGGGARRRGGGAKGASEAMARCVELLDRIAPMTPKTERLLEELERTRPFTL